MKESLDPESRAAIIEYRLEKSRDAMKEAALLADGNFFDSAVTRLYYACFYAVSALLISKSIECNSHAGAKRMFSLHFIRTSLVDQKHITTYSNLMQGRQLCDYEDFIYQNAESYALYRSQAEALIDAITPLIQA